MAALVVRKATAGDATALAALRLRAVTDGQAEAAVLRDEFTLWFASWAREHLATHMPFIAELDGEAVGVAWLLVAQRVPGLPQLTRLCGDVQSVYVSHERRGSGTGTALLSAVLDEARALGLEHVTVHANDRAAALYLRAGFRNDEHWLSWSPAAH
jgi:GNAT superfamily N-acetyltransferase